MASIIDSLAQSDYPSIRYRVLTELQGENPESESAQAAQALIPQDPIVKALLADRTPDGRLPYKAYRKWIGAHWVLVTLADLNYPPGDQSLIPLREQMLDYILHDLHVNYIKTRMVAGRMRMHPSIEGNAIYALLKLGLADERVDHLVKVILSWRWPDGGWNCRMKPETVISSFMETLIPLRGLALYQKQAMDNQLAGIIPEIAEVFLRRHLFKRVKNSRVMDKTFIQLHYPCYWHYDILFALKVMAEAGLINDPRCNDALKLLRSKRLPNGGFPAEDRFYRTSGSKSTGYSNVDWGGVNKKRANSWVTIDSLSVLIASGITLI